MELSPQGHAQARTLAEYLGRKGIHALYASPMKRALQTLAPLAPHCGRPPVVLPELREVDFGDWTGLNWDEVRARFHASAYEWLRKLEDAAIPNGECARTFRARVEPCVQRILREHPGQNVAVLCHGGVVRMILSILLGLPLSQMAAFEIDYASVTHVEVNAHKLEVQLLNFAPWRELP
jgi:broad specificity phosphatase PhoE